MRSNLCIIGVKRSKNILYKSGKAPASIVQGNKRQVANIRLIIYSTRRFYHG